MSPLWGQTAGVVTVVLMIVFIGIWIWAWRPRHQATFDSLACLPMLDDAQRSPDDEGDET